MKTILTAPPGAIYNMLLFAAEGLAAENGFLSPTGKPRLLERASWIIMLRLCLETPEGQRRLRELMIEGIRRGGWPEDYVECVKSFSREREFRARSIAMLEELADTARWRFTLPGPPFHPPAADAHPRSQRAKPGPPRPPPKPSRRQKFTPS